VDIMIALVFFGVGLGLIIFFAEQLVKGVVGTSVGFGLSTFLLSVIFIGFDPDNLAVSTVASAEGITRCDLQWKSARLAMEHPLTKSA
jgi:cation:H+ antiporter